MPFEGFGDCFARFAALVEQIERFFVVEQAERVFAEVVEQQEPERVFAEVVVQQEPERIFVEVVEQQEPERVFAVEQAVVVELFVVDEQLERFAVVALQVVVAVGGQLPLLLELPAAFAWPNIFLIKMGTCKVLGFGIGLISPIEIS
jgi:hypothetical protein